MRREPTPEEEAAAGNGELLMWMEYEAEVNRDKSEYYGGSAVDAPTNVEMHNACRGMNRDYLEGIAMKLTGHKGHFLKAVDVEKPKLWTIRNASVELIEGDRGEQVEKEVLWFEETEQGLVLNKTNTATLVEVTGTDDSDEMAGKKIVLFKAKTDFGGRQVDCIRLRAPKTQQPKPEPEQDDLPF